MGTASNHEVLPITLKEIPKAAETLYQAFENDKLMLWMLGSLENYRKNAKQIFESWVRYGVLYGIALRTENFESVMVNRKSGDISFSFWKMLRSGMLSSTKLFGKEGIKHIMLLGKLLDKAKKEYHKKHPFIYLWLLGTRPDMLNKGYSKALFTETFKMAAEQDLYCYCETVTGSEAERTHIHNGGKPIQEIQLSDDLNVTVLALNPKDLGATNELD